MKMFVEQGPMGGDVEAGAEVGDDPIVEGEAASTEIIPQVSKQKSSFILDNIYIVAPLIFFLSLAIGIIFYMYINNWDFLLAYYFAASVLLGALYLVPAESSPYSQIFTQWYFLWGTTLLMGAIAAMANQVLANAGRVAADERERIISQLESPDIDGDGVITLSERIEFYTVKWLNIIGWRQHRAKYSVMAVAVIVYVLGILYGVYFEGWELPHAMYFSLSAMSASGTSPPTCENGDTFTCKLGPMRSLLLGTYIIIAVPVFTYTMGQFAEILVERAIRARERQLMLRPLSDSEFRFAVELQSGLRGELSPSKEVRLTLTDFVILELLRLQKISKQDLNHIKDMFEMLDVDGDGVIIQPAMETKKPFVDMEDPRFSSLSRIRNEGHFQLSPIASDSFNESEEDVYQFEKESNSTHHDSVQHDGDNSTNASYAHKYGDDTSANTGADDGDTSVTKDEDEFGGMSEGYNNLIIPLLRQIPTLDYHGSASMTRRNSMISSKSSNRMRSFSQSSTKSNMSGKSTKERLRRMTVSSTILYANNESTPLLASSKRFNSSSSVRFSPAESQ
jgi:hypothetical protein